MFIRARWLHVADKYEDDIYLYRRYRVHRLAVIACTSVDSASNAIEIYQSVAAMPRRELQGHGSRGVVSLSGWEPRHDAYMYELYLKTQADL